MNTIKGIMCKTAKFSAKTKGAKGEKKQVA